MNNGRTPAARHTASGTPFRLFVFDLDGTLIDSRRDLADSVNALLIECGAPPLAEERVGRMVGDGAATLVARAFAAGGIPMPSDALSRFLAIYARHLTDHTRPYDGIPDVLAQLRGRPALLAVLTNKPLQSTRTILERLDLARYFATELVLGGDGPFPRKPDPSGLRSLLESTSTPPESAVLVGDSMIDCRTARAAGTRLCIARYGFGFDTFPAEHITSADFGVSAPLDLLGV